MKEAVQLLGTLYKGDTTPNAPSFLTEKVLNGQQAHLCMLLKTEFETASKIGYSDC